VNRRLALAALAACVALAADWPQAAGPAGHWRVSGNLPPVEWSVSLNRNITWRTALPNGGQSGIAVSGDRVFLTSEADVATWSALVGDDGSLSDLRLFVNQGGEGVATDTEGNVYIAAGDILVYDRTGTLIETIPVPGRPTQVVFGGPDGRTLFLPARDALYAVRTRAAGR
jgi:sugar lactone lactonase YvrE